MTKAFSTNKLKILAIIAMACDHIPFLTMYMPEYWLQMDYYSAPWFLFHAFGRITAPVFFYLLALGYLRTHNANLYMLRLLVFALLSYVPYIWYFKGAPPDEGNYFELNVIFTMLFGLLLLRSMYEIRNMALKIVCVALCLFGGYWCDYGIYGLAMILVCSIAKDSRLAVTLGMAAVIMTQVYFQISSNFMINGPYDFILILQNPVQLYYIIVILCQFIPIIFIAFHSRWISDMMPEPRPKAFAKWGFYIFYPAHITVLLLIRLVLPA